MVVTIGDLNGDGRLDIVTGTEHARGRIYSLLGKGDGTFFAPVAAPPFTFSPFTSVIIANINGDPKPDVLVSGTDGNVVDVLHGNGDGTFTYAISTDRIFVGSNPTGVAVADLNGDGKLDFVVANTDDNTMSVFFGIGGGGFTRVSPAPPITGAYGFESVAVADFNGDGKVDLAVTYGASRLSILLGDGHGTFIPAPGSPITVNGGNNLAVTGDFNGDGKADLALLLPGGSLYVLLGNGDGTFNTPIITPPPNATFWNTIAVGDVNGDGKADLALGDFVHNTVTPLFGAGNGTFTVGSPITVGQNPADVEIADLNGDGKGDIVVTNPTDNTVTVLLSNSSGNGTFTQALGSPIPVGMAPHQVVIADLNGDGKKDLVVANLNDRTVSVLLGVGNGTFTAAPNSPIANAEGNNGVLAVGDVNGDGIPDLAIPDANGDGFIDILTGNGNGSFTANYGALGGAPDILAFGDVNRFTLADVNGDGKRDIITVGGNISVLLNTSVFAPPTPNPLPPPQPTGAPIIATPLPLPKPPQPTGLPITNATPLPLPPRRP
ncbi:MAG: FG-GAP repeat domain-containing protein, partial [Thermomicrobiales bacterium]